MDKRDEISFSRAVPGEIKYWRDIWKNVHRDLPREIFHYTDATGLSGIVRTGKMWATHANYHNDLQEFKYARTVISQRFKDRIERSTPSEATRLNQLHERYESHASISESMADAYMVCFCEDGNLLSQWRAYAANGDGFALGFDPRHLMESLNADFAPYSKMFKVIYDPEEQREFIDLAMDQLLEALNNGDTQTILDQVASVFSEMACSFKHKAFAEEREWRLVHIPAPNNCAIDVRISNGRLLPFAMIPICAPDERPPYFAVKHGPTLESKNTTKAIQILLSKAHPRYWNGVCISGSDAPLRAR